MKRIFASSFKLAVILMVALVCGIQVMTMEPDQVSSSAAEVARESGETFVVTSTADSGPGTLRQALLDARSGDTITFDSTVFLPAAPMTVTLMTPLPILTHGNLTLDASSAGVVLDGSQLNGEEIHGLDIRSNGNAVRRLEIRGFPGAGVGLSEGSHGNIVSDNLLTGNGSFGVGIWGPETVGNTIQDNTIGTDRSGQVAGNLTRDGIHINGADQNTLTGNLIASAGQSGIYICCGAASNTINNNTIGLARDEATALPNGQAGVTIDQGAHDTMVGPGNTIAHNPIGVDIIGATSVGNTITQNRISGNAEGISLKDGNGDLRPPIIIGFDLSAGNIEGVTCANCAVEVFSTIDDQGDAYEARTNSDHLGYFTLDTGGAFEGPHLTATATDATGNTSGFSRPTSGTRQSVDLQANNINPKTVIPTRSTSQLAENKVGSLLSLHDSIQTAEHAAQWMDWYRGTGLKWAHLSLDSLDWYEGIPASAFEVDPIHDQFITDLVKSGVSINYLLIFWDGEITGDATPGYSRFRDPDEVHRYLEYARFIVNHFKGRIKHYQILHETYYADGGCGQQNIQLSDYVELLKKAEEVIHEEDPQAVVVAGSAPSLYDQGGYDYQIGILSSEAMSVTDGVAWHPGPYPLEISQHVDYLYRVPGTVEELKQTASIHGFTGDVYICDGLFWPTAYNPSPSEPWNVYSETIAAKYYGRGILDHRGMGLHAMLGATATEGNLPKMDVVRNSANLLAGAEATPLPLQIQSTLTDIVSYTFAYGDSTAYLIGLWQGGFASNEIQPGTPLTLAVSGLTASHSSTHPGDWSVTGYDVLHSFQQPLDAHWDENSLVIPNLQVRDYPLVLRLERIRRMCLPIMLRNAY